MPESVDLSGLKLARAGDGTAFRRLTDDCRRELTLHCYRLLGATSDAEDAVQETWIRAWRSLDSFEGRSSFRAWLYRIATNVCLSELERRPRRHLPVDYSAPADPSNPLAPPLADSVWIEPLPDTWIAGTPLGPDARYSLRESVTLAFSAALQLLPPKQRAILILRDVLGLEAAEVAEQLELTVPSVTSALHRARETIQQRARTVSAMTDAPFSELLARYVHAWESADVSALLSVLRDDACLSMPPQAMWFRGHAAIGAFFQIMIRPGALRYWATTVNGQPGFAVYRRSEGGTYLPYGVQALTIEDELITESIMFFGMQHFARFDVPEFLEPR